MTDLRFTVLILLISFLAFSGKEPYLDKTGAMKGYAFLNHVRTTPKRLLKHIGIGCAYAGEGKQFKTYTCVIVARHPGNLKKKCVPLIEKYNDPL